MSRYFGRIKEESATTGVGPLTLGGAAGAAGAFHTFASRFALFERLKFTIALQSDESQNETCEGYLSSSTVLVRERVIESSNGDALVSFTGATYVWCDFTGEDATAAMSSSFLLLSRGNFLQ